MQSRLWQAGSMPQLESSPRDGLTPIRLLNAAGTRPEPAVSVPREKLTWPSATETALPALEPPLIYFSSNEFLGAPYGERVPLRPVANWSRLVLPIGMAPASISNCTTKADLSGVYAYSGQAAVVGTAARSILSFIANGTPYNGSEAGSFCSS